MEGSCQKGEWLPVPVMFPSSRPESCVVINAADQAAPSFRVCSRLGFVFQWLGGRTGGGADGPAVHVFCNQV